MAIPKLDQILFRSHIISLIRKKGPGPTGTVFHSGMKYKKAFDEAEKIGKVPLAKIVKESKEKGSGFSTTEYKGTLGAIRMSKNIYVKNGGDAADHQKAWDIASEEYARYVQKETTLLTSKVGPEPDSVWKRMEEPVLMRNGIAITTKVVV